MYNNVNQTVNFLFHRFFSVELYISICHFGRSSHLVSEFILYIPTSTLAILQNQLALIMMYHRPIWMARLISFFIPHFQSSPRQAAAIFEEESEEGEHPSYSRRQTPTKAIDTSKKGFLRFLENDGNQDDMPTVYDLYDPSGTYAPQDKRSGSPRSHHRVRPKSCMARIQRRDKSALPTGTKLYEDDFMVAQFVHVGDRVRVKKNASKVICKWMFTYFCWIYS